MLSPRRKTVVLLVLAVLTLPAGAAGCGYGAGADTSSDEPFYTDRVVTVHIVMEVGDWEYTLDNPLAEEYVKADLWYDGELVPDVAVRPKGNSSLRTVATQGTSIRYSLKVDLNFFNSARNLGGVKKLCFNNGWSDASFMREVLGYRLYEQMGVPSPRASFVDLWVNDTHLGLYTMVEAIDKAFISNNFTDNTGNLYKPEMPAAYLNWTEEDYEKQRENPRFAAAEGGMDEAEINLGGGNLMEILRALDADRSGAGADAVPGIAPGLRPPGGMPGLPRGDFLEQMGLKTNENKPEHALLFRLLDVLNNEPDETFPAEIEKVLDVDEALRFLAVSALIVHLDNYIAMGHNYYLYENEARFVILPWDLNMAFGTFNFGLSRDKLVNYYIDEPSGGPMAERPLIERLMSHRPYREAYHGYLNELLAGPFDAGKMNLSIDGFAALIRPYVEADESKFFSAEQFEAALVSDSGQRVGFVGPRAPGLKAFIAERARSVEEQLAGTRQSGPGDGSGNGGSFGMGPNLPPPGRFPRDLVPDRRANQPR